MKLRTMNKIHSLTIEGVELTFKNLSAALTFLSMRNKAIKEIEEGIKTIKYIKEECSELLNTTLIRVRATIEFALNIGLITHADSSKFYDETAL